MLGCECDPTEADPGLGRADSSIIPCRLRHSYYLRRNGTTECYCGRTESRKARTGERPITMRRTPRVVWILAAPPRQSRTTAGGTIAPVLFFANAINVRVRFSRMRNSPKCRCLAEPTSRASEAPPGMKNERRLSVLMRRRIDDQERARHDRR